MCLCPLSDVTAFALQMSHMLDSILPPERFWKVEACLGLCAYEKTGEIVPYSASKLPPCLQLFSGCRWSTPIPLVLWSTWMGKNDWRGAGALAHTPGFVWESCPKTPQQGKGWDDTPFPTDTPHAGHSLRSVAWWQSRGWVPQDYLSGVVLHAMSMPKCSLLFESKMPFFIERELEAVQLQSWASGHSLFITGFLSELSNERRASCIKINFWI